MFSVNIIPDKIFEKNARPMGLRHIDRQVIHFIAAGKDGIFK